MAADDKEVRVVKRRVNTEGAPGECSPKCAAQLIKVGEMPCQPWCQHALDPEQWARSCHLPGTIIATPRCACRCGLTVPGVFPRAAHSFAESSARGNPAEPEHPGGWFRAERVSLYLVSLLP